MTQGHVVKTRIKPPEVVRVRVRVPLDFPLPQRDWFRTAFGGWSSRAWTKESYAEALHANYKWITALAASLPA